MKRHLRNLPVSIDSVMHTFDEANVESVLHTMFKWALGRRKTIPLCRVAEFIQQMSLVPVPWASGNVWNREWFAYSISETIKEDSGVVMTADEASDVFNVPKHSRGCGYLYECVNGTLLLRKGLQYQAEVHGWCPEKNKFYPHSCRETEYELDGNCEVLRTSTLVDILTTWDMHQITWISNLCGWEMGPKNVQDLNKATDYLFQRLGVQLVTNAKRDPVKEWDDSVISGSRFMMASGSGSNIRVASFKQIPSTPVAVKET